MQAKKADYPHAKRCRKCGDILLATNFSQIMITARGNSAIFVPAGDITVVCKCNEINVINIKSIIRSGKQAVAV